MLICMYMDSQRHVHVHTYIYTYTHIGPANTPVKLGFQGMDGQRHVDVYTYIYKYMHTHRSRKHTREARIPGYGWSASGS
jgi:hypothetical protein